MTGRKLYLHSDAVKAIGAITPIFAADGDGTSAEMAPTERNQKQISRYTL